MSLQIFIISLLTFVIHFVGTSIYAVRIVGLRTMKISIAYVFFNIISIAARFANTLQAPMLATIVERNIKMGKTQDFSDFRIILIASSIGTLAGALAIPSLQRFMELGINSFYQHRSVIKVIAKGLNPRLFKHIRASAVIPKKTNLDHFKNSEDIPRKVIFLNVVVNALVTVSVLACLYAGYLNPDYRSTAASMDGMASGIAVILSLIFVDPDMAYITDDVMAGKRSQRYFRKYIIYVLAARFVGTLLAQLLIVPTSYFIIWVAEHLYF